MRNLLLVFIMIFLVCSCAKEKDLDENNNGKATCVVKFAPTRVDIVASTKAGCSFLPQGEGVGIAAYAVSSNVEATEYTQFKKFSVVDAVGTITPDDGVDMRIYRNADYMFYAYSPAIDFKAGSKKIISIDQGTDFKMASVIKTMALPSQTLELPALSRKCSYVQFVAQAVPGTYVKTISIGANGFTFNNMTHSPIDYTLGEANIDLTGAALDASGSIAQSAFTTTTPDIQYVGGTAVLPKVDGPFTLTLDVSLNSVRQTMAAAIPTLPFVPGYIYRFSLVFCDPGLTLVLQVLPWTDLAELNDLGTGNGVITAAQWTNILNVLNMGTNANFITTAQWISILNALNMGTNSSNITVASWTNAMNAVLNQGGGVYATVVVGSWGVTNTWDNTQGVHQGGITLSDWTVNPNWNANIGVALAGMGIAAWNNGSSTTTMGE